MSHAMLGSVSQRRDSLYSLDSLQTAFQRDPTKEHQIFLVALLCITAAPFAVPARESNTTAPLQAERCHVDSSPEANGHQLRGCCVAAAGSAAQLRRILVNLLQSVEDFHYRVIGFGLSVVMLWN